MSGVLHERSGCAILTWEGIFNAAENRWQARGADNWACRRFNRHRGSESEVFFDGHIESLPLSVFTRPYSAHIVRPYFDPYYEE